MPNVMAGVRKKWIAISLLGAMAPAWMFFLCSGCDKSESASSQAAADVYEPDADTGHDVFMTGCVTCHGTHGQGLPHQGAALRTSEFIATHTDKELMEFIKKGRDKNDPTNKTGNPMPPNGNIPGLNDDRRADVVAFLRQLQQEAKDEAKH